LIDTGKEIYLNNSGKLNYRFDQADLTELREMIDENDYEFD